MTAFFSQGFRCFFAAAALAAGVLPLAALYFLYHGPGDHDLFLWHGHEMIFGFNAAVLAGFVTTAMPNWTGRPSLPPWLFAGLISLWLAGRLVMACPAWFDPAARAGVDLLFLFTLAMVVWRELLAAGNRRNLIVAGLITLIAIANLLFHLGESGALADPRLGPRLGLRLGLGLFLLLIGLIGGRIVPAFTRNWLAQKGEALAPAEFSRVDRATLLALVLGLAVWIIYPTAAFSGPALIVAGLAQGLRLARWRGLATRQEPLLLALHLGYGWLALGLVILGASLLWPTLPLAPLHALTTGAIGTMTATVMCRAARGHSGQSLEADGATKTLLGLITLGALVRTLAPAFGALEEAALLLAGFAWSGGFLLFLISHARLLFATQKFKA